MKLVRKYLALMLAVMHTLTYSATAQQIMNLQNGSTTQVESVHVTEGDSLTINVLNELGEVCQDCRAILETNGLLNNGAIDIWGILAIISPTIINNGVITVQGDLLLSNLGINKEAFFAGMAELSRDPSLANGFILNTGEIRNLTQGLIAMVAANGGVHNLGTISSNGGAVALVAGDRVSFPLTRDGVLNISLDGVTGVKGQVFDKNGNLVETQGLVTNDGLIQANGGAVVLQAAGAEQIFDSIINHTGIIEAKSIEQKNGKIILKSDIGNIHIDDAKIDASGLNAGETGGSIQVLTKGNIVIDGKTVIDASGDQGGGEVLIGGDIHGTGLVAAANVGIGEDVTVKADAVTQGNGGKIVVWSEGSTLAYGNLSAQGGSQAGNGGFIETSGKEYLDVNDIGINASAANGEAGTWLLDPRNVTISNSNTTNPPGAPGAGAWTFTPVSNNSNVKVSDITGKLNAGTNVTITTGTTGTQNGNITISNAIAKTAGSAATLTLTAAGNILMNSAVTATVGILNVVLNAGGNINVSQAITTNGGFVQAQANGDVSLTNAAGDITTGGGAVAISADQDANGSGNFSSVSGANINTAGGNATISAVDFNPLGTINAGVGQVTVAGSQSGATIRIGGGSTPATMQITDAEADLITANSLTIGNASSGNIFVGDLSPANVNTLVLKTAGSITDNNVAVGDNDAGADITVANLGLQAGGAVDLDLAVNTLGLQAGGATDLSDASGFAIGLVGGISGLSLTNQNLTLSGGSFSFGQTLNLGTGSLTLNSTGSVTGTNNQSAEIIANNVAINAVSGIDLEINAGTIAFNNSTSGNVSVEDLAGGLVVGTVGSIVGGTNNGGNITVMTHSPLTIASNVSVGAGANINLHAFGNLAVDDLTINSGVTISSTGGNGNILLTAGDTVLLDTNAIVRTTGTGTVTAFAGENFTDSILNFDGNANGTVQMNSGSAIRSEDGNITVNALKSTRITEINADSDNDNIRGNIFIEARNGFISDRNGGAVNLIGNQAVLNADQGIGDTVVADDDEIETNLNSLDVINSVSGHLNILEVAAGGALNIVRAFQDNGGDLNIRTEDGSLTVNAVGSGVRATSGRMHLEAAGNGSNDDLVISNNVTSTTGKIELTSGSRDILVGATGNVASTSGEIQADSMNKITMTRNLSNRVVATTI